MGKPGSGCIRCRAGSLSGILRVQPEDPVVVPGMGKMVGDGEKGQTGDGEKRTFDLLCRGKIQRGGAFIQNEKGCVPDQGPGNGYPLALTAGEKFSPLPTGWSRPSSS